MTVSAQDDVFTVLRIFARLSLPRDHRLYRCSHRSATNPCSWHIHPWPNYFHFQLSKFRASPRLKKILEFNCNLRKPRRSLKAWSWTYFARRGHAKWVSNSISPTSQCTLIPQYIKTIALGALWSSATTRNLAPSSNQGNYVLREHLLSRIAR